MIKGKRYKHTDSAYSEYVYTCMYVSKSLAVLMTLDGTEFVIYKSQFNQYEEYVPPVKLFVNVYQIRGKRELKFGNTMPSREEAMMCKFESSSRKYITTIEVEV